MSRAGSGNQSSPGLIYVVQSLIQYEMERINEKVSKAQVQSKIKTLGRAIGERLMLRVSNTSIERTQTTQSILELFVTDFWKEAFGKAANQVKLNQNSQQVVFMDEDFELLNKLSSSDQRLQQEVYEFTRIFVLGIIEGSFQVFKIKTDVKISLVNHYSHFEIQCI